MAGPRLVTRADDLGSFRSANRATLDTVEQGICRNVSLMACTPQIEHAAELLAGNTTACFGLHMTIHCEWSDPHRFTMLSPPDAAPELLYDDGNLVPLWGDPFKNGVAVEQVLAEMDRQLARARQLGFDVRYADTHMNFHAQEGWREALGEWCRRNDLIWFPEAIRVANEGAPAAKDDQRAKGDQGARRAKGVEGLVERIRDLDDDRVAVLVKHPCYDDDEMRDVAYFDHPNYARHVTPVGEDRDLQRRCFMDPRVLDAVAERGAVPTRVDEL